MIFLPFVLVCSLALGFQGDEDTGSTCRMFYDANQVGYATLTECQKRAEAIFEEIFADQVKLTRILSGPWRAKGECRMEVLNETVL